SFPEPFASLGGSGGDRDLPATALQTKPATRGWPDAPRPPCRGHTGGSVPQPERDDRQVVGFERRCLDRNRSLLEQGAQRLRLRLDSLDDRVDERALGQFDMAIDHGPGLLEARVRCCRARVRGEVEGALSAQLGAPDVPAAAVRAAGRRREGELAARLALLRPYDPMGEAIVEPLDRVALFIHGLHLTFLPER